MKLAVLLPMTCIHYHRAALLVLGKLPKHGSRTWPKHCLVQHVLCKLGLPVLTQPISVSNGLALVCLLCYCTLASVLVMEEVWCQEEGNRKLFPPPAGLLRVYGRSVISFTRANFVACKIWWMVHEVSSHPHAKRMRGDLKLHEPSITRSRHNPSRGTHGWLVMNAISVMYVRRSWSIQLQI